MINPGDRRLQVDRVVALPELYGPSVRGIPLAEHGFIRVDPHGQVLERGRSTPPATRSTSRSSTAGSPPSRPTPPRESIAALAGAPITPKPFHPVIHGMLLTGGSPVYLTAQITGGHGFSSEITDTPTWSPPSKIAAKYLAPYLEAHDGETSAS